MTLTELASYIRRFLPFAVVFSLLILILYFVIRLFMVFFQGPAASIETTPIFGKIKAPLISNASPSADLKFTLDNVEGEAVTATSAAKVFFLTPPRTSIGYREKIAQTARAIGIDTQATSHTIAGSEATFQDPQQNLIINISNFNFSYQYNSQSTGEAALTDVAPSRETAQDEATTFLQSVGRYPQELFQGKSSSSQSGDSIRIDYWRPDIDGFPTVSPEYFSSQNFVTFRLEGINYRVIEAQIKFFEKSEEQIGVYPVKSGKEAYEALTMGRGMVVANPSNLKDIKIRKMFLGYYDPDFYQQYLQPVYVFVGDDDFVAYVPAVSDEFLTEE